MSVAMLEDIFDPGIGVLGSAQTSKGVITIQTGDPVTREVVSDNAEWWQHVGFASRPARPTPGKSACQVIALTQGSNDIAIASRDTRCGLPAGLGPGETVVFAGGPENAGTGQVRLEDNGSRALITIQARRGNTASGEIVKIELGSDGTIKAETGASGLLRVTPTGVEIGSGALDAAARASAIQSFATDVVAKLNAVISGIASLGIVVPPVSPLASSVASTTVRISA